MVEVFHIVPWLPEILPHLGLDRFGVGEGGGSPLEEAPIQGARSRNITCAVGFEANPVHTRKLRMLERQLTAAGRRIRLHTATAVGGRDGTAKFYVASPKTKRRTAEVYRRAGLPTSSAPLLASTGVVSALPPPPCCKEM